MIAEKDKTRILANINAVNTIPGVTKILEVICHTTGMGFAAVAYVTKDNWVACAVRDEIQFGLRPGGELKVDTTICCQVRQTGKGVIIDHVALDEVYSCHPTPAMYGFQSYISVPIILSDGSFFGTLCAIDPKPANLRNPAITGMFQLFAELIAFHLNANQQLELAKSLLQQERKTADLREQFIAILGHDLRNPVGASLNSAQLLLRKPLDEQSAKLASVIRDSQYRIKGLINNLLDFANGRMGSGIVLNCKEENLEITVKQVIAEIKAIWPDRLIQEDFSFQSTVFCDGKRIAQLFSNLLSNALSHGTPDTPVTVTACTRQGALSLSVCNAGNKIPEAAMAQLFQPFSRGEAGNTQGLGLGLYIASEIAKAHRAGLDVQSTDEKTCFTLRLNSPVSPS